MRLQFGVSDARSPAVQVSAAAATLAADAQPTITANLLTPEQLAVAKKVLAGENIFLTGAAGTGKSYLFKYLVAELHKKHGKDNVAVKTFFSWVPLSPTLCPKCRPAHVMGSERSCFVACCSGLPTGWYALPEQCHCGHGPSCRKHCGRGRCEQRGGLNHIKKGKV